MSPAKRSASIEAEMQFADLDQDGELNRDELYRFYYGRLCTMLPLELGYSVSTSSMPHAVPQCPATLQVTAPCCTVLPCTSQNQRRCKQLTIRRSLFASPGTGL